MKLISKDALAAEMDRRLDELYNLLPDASKVENGMITISEACNTGKYTALESFKKYIDALEVKEVDLEKEIKNKIDEYWYDNDYGAIQRHGGTITMEVSDVKEIAKHFFELGLKAKDWEKERMEECPYRQVGCTMYEGKILECRGACSWVVDYPKLKELKAKKVEEV